MRAGDNAARWSGVLHLAKEAWSQVIKANIECVILPGSSLHRSEGRAQLGVAAHTLSAPWTLGLTLTLGLSVAGCNSQAGSLTLLVRLACVLLAGL